MTQDASNRPFLNRSVLVGVLYAASGMAIAQDQGGNAGAESIVEAKKPGVELSLNLNAGFRGESDFDSPVGTIESSTFGAELVVLIPAGDRGRLKLGFGASVTEYDITPVTGAVGTTAATVGAQFDTVTELGVDAMYFRSLDADTSFYVGGGIGNASEGGADDALTWKALGGLTFKMSDRLKLGIGVAVVSRIEDDVRVVPLPQIEFLIDDRWTLKSEGPGLRLDYKWNDELSMGISGRFDGQSFRIDSDNTLVPDGAVTMTGVPLSYYLEYSGGEQSKVSLFAEVGVVVAGQMEILNSSGNTVVEEDIDPGVFLSGGIRIKF